MVHAPRLGGLELRRAPLAAIGAIAGPGVPSAQCAAERLDRRALDGVPRGGRGEERVGRHGGSRSGGGGGGGQAGLAGALGGGADVRSAALPLAGDPTCGAGETKNISKGTCGGTCADAESDCAGSL